MEHIRTNVFDENKKLREELEYKDKKLSREVLFDLHRLITKDTLEQNKQGRYRKDSDDVTINDKLKFIYYVPPKEAFVTQEIDRLIKYANDEDSQGFAHPIIKAIFLHFWIGILHPFCDGNGRLARTLFYWYGLHSVRVEAFITRSKYREGIASQ